MARADEYKGEIKLTEDDIEVLIDGESIQVKIKDREYELAKYR